MPLTQSLLSFPLAYSGLQWLIGATRQRHILVTEYLQPRTGARVLDIGCGPAGILGELRRYGVRYDGFDASEPYITAAKEQWKGPQYAFHRRSLEEGLAKAEADAYDIVLALSLLHHLGDESAEMLFRAAKRCLRPGGKLLTLDPCRFENMNPIESALANFDRGKHVRFAREYESLIRQAFPDATVTIRRGLGRLPARSIVMDARKAEAKAEGHPSATA
jgi:2-polyprenyl-3-methyl-5-hydroxy-6-metoxy-1,4-benzoquinol methylase